jgi:hypothetical protein
MQVMETEKCGLEEERLTRLNREGMNGCVIAAKMHPSTTYAV